MNIMNATKNFFRIPKFLHSLDKSQVSKSFQGHSYWFVDSEFKKAKTYVCCFEGCIYVTLTYSIVSGKVTEPLTDWIVSDGLGQVMLKLLKWR